MTPEALHVDRQHDHPTCPFCEADLCAGLIPESQRENYSSNCFSRLIGIYDRDRDRTVAWRCPDCQKEWPR